MDALAAAAAEGNGRPGAPLLRGTYKARVRTRQCHPLSASLLAFVRSPIHALTPPPLPSFHFLFPSLPPSPLPTHSAPRLCCSRLSRTAGGTSATTATRSWCTSSTSSTRSDRSSPPRKRTARAPRPPPVRRTHAAPARCARLSASACLPACLFACALLSPTAPDTGRDLRPPRLPVAQIALLRRCASLLAVACRFAQSRSQRRTRRSCSA